MLKAIKCSQRLIDKEEKSKIHSNDINERLTEAMRGGKMLRYYLLAQQTESNEKKREREMYKHTPK